MIEWDDLRYFLELARSGTLTETARRLEVKHTTVGRRIQRLEVKLGFQLFDRTLTGYRLTGRGTALLNEVQSIEEKVRHIGGGPTAIPDEVSGLVRVGCTEGYGIGIIPQHIASFQIKYPSVSVDLIVQPRAIHIARKEADIVINIDRPRKGSNIITKLADYELKLFGSSHYLARTSAITCTSDLRSHRIISYIEEGQPARDLPSIKDLFRASQSNIRSTSLLAQIRLIEAGAGVGILPTYLARHGKDLVEVLPNEVRFTRTYWMVMASELKHVPRVQAVWQHLKKAARDHNPPLLTSD